MAEYVNTALERMELLIGNDVKKLQEATVLVVGIGGVGSYAVEALSRSGIQHLVLVDADTVALSNFNRQIHANYQTLNQYKTLAMKERIHTFNPNCNIETYEVFYNEETQNEIFNQKIDFVVDAIDTMSSKLLLIQYCKQHNIPFICSMGMANRLDPTKVMITDLMKTNYDPVSKIMRNLVRKNKIKGKIPVVFSSEQPITQNQIINENGVTRKMKMPPASAIFVPAAAGLAIASYVMKEIIKRS